MAVQFYFANLDDRISIVLATFMMYRLTKVRKWKGPQFTGHEFCHTYFDRKILTFILKYASPWIIEKFTTSISSFIRIWYIDIERGR